MSLCRAHRYDLWLRRSLVCDTVDSSVTKQWVQQGVSLEGLHLWKGRRVHQKAGLGPWDLYRHHKIDVIYQHLHVNCVEFFSRWGMGGAVCVNMMDGRKEFLPMTRWAVGRRKRIPVAVLPVFRWMCWSLCCVMFCWFLWLCVSFFVVWWYLKINQKF